MILSYSIYRNQKLPAATHPQKAVCSLASIPQASLEATTAVSKLTTTSDCKAVRGRAKSACLVRRAGFFCEVCIRKWPGVLNLTLPQAISMLASTSTNILEMDGNGFFVHVKDAGGKFWDPDRQLGKDTQRPAVEPSSLCNAGSSSRRNASIRHTTPMSSGFLSVG